MVQREYFPSESCRKGHGNVRESELKEGVQSYRTTSGSPHWERPYFAKPMAQIKCEGLSRGQSAGEPLINDHVHKTQGTAGTRRVTSDEKVEMSNLFINCYRRAS